MTIAVDWDVKHQTKKYQSINHFLFSGLWGCCPQCCILGMFHSERYDVCLILHISNRVMSGKFRHQVNSDTHLQIVEIQMRWLLKIFTVCLVNLFFIPITEL